MDMVRENARGAAALRGWRILSNHQSRGADRVAMRARRRPDLVDVEYVPQSILLQMICARGYMYQQQSCQPCRISNWSLEAGCLFCAA